MFSNKLLLFYLLTSFSLFACNEQDKIDIEKSASAFDIKQGEASVLQSNKHLMKAFEAGDSVEVGESYTTDGELMVPNHATIYGRDNIIHYFSNIMAHSITHINLETVKIWGDSSILVEEGTYQVSDKKKNLLDDGKYIVLWKLEAGNWKMYRDIWASNRPVSAAKPDSLKLNPKSAKK